MNKEEKPDIAKDKLKITAIVLILISVIIGVLYFFSIFEIDTMYDAWIVLIGFFLGLIGMYISGLGVDKK